MDKMYYFTEQAQLALEKGNELLHADSVFDRLGCDHKTARDAIYSNSEVENKNEEKEEESEAVSNGVNSDKVYEQIHKLFDKKIEALSYDYIILGWSCYIHRDARKDCKVKFEKTVHNDAVKQIIIKLYVHPVYADLPEIINIFWKESRMFVVKTEKI